MRNLFVSLRGIFSPRRVDSSARPTSRRRIRENRKRLRNRRIKAILAGGLVFGIGATATVAAWTDTEEASGSFKAGTFNIELSTDHTGWESTDEMAFATDAMFPNSKVYASVFVRTDPSTSIGGDLTVTGGEFEGAQNALANALRYKAVTQSLKSEQEWQNFSCEASSFGESSTYVFGNQNATVALTTTDPGGGPQHLDSGGGSIQAYCFEVSLPNGATTDAQGQSAIHKWTFKAVSVAPVN